MTGNGSASRVWKGEQENIQEKYFLMKFSERSFLWILAEEVS